MECDAGDILISTKGFGHAGVGVCNLFGPARSASGPPGRAIEVMHAVNSGVVEGWGLKAFIYRPLKLTFGEAKKITTIAGEIKAGAEYGVARAIFKSWTGSSTFGSGAQARLKKYRERLQLNDTAAGKGGKTIPIVKHVFCSEFVILCYQLALGEDHPLFIKLDGLHTLPGGLKTYLDGKSDTWRQVGEVEP
jgi:hypothetical protein